ncbi:hypothetical protein TNCV_1869181 [Trichonephila clavipes]|nr:hypothetical protein TNCV_1869181 [Trichonephila clavipes]
MVECRLPKFLESKDAINDCQAHSKTKVHNEPSCETYPDNKRWLPQKKQCTLAVLVDFKAAYDKMRQGLPQGAVLSSLLFNIMIADVVADVVTT